MSAVTTGVKIDGVSKRFAHRVKGEIYAVRDVSLDVRPGGFLTLLGPSGCGKTTTLRMIAGFETPDAGHIRLGERDVTEPPANRGDSGFVFQNCALFPHLSVFEDTAYGLRVREVADEDIGKRVGDVLALVGLAGYEQQFSVQLSGGEQQRVALARAIVIRPSVLLFDEPLSNLDAKLRVQMRQEIRDLQRRLGITTVYVTHDQEEAMAVSDRIAVMQRGRVVQEGTAEDLYYRPSSQFVAQFVGRVNLIAGRVSEIATDIARVEALGTTFGVRAASMSLAPGNPVQLVIRPETIDIMHAKSGLLAAAVESRTFLGEKIEYVVRCNGEALQVVRNSSGRDEAFPWARRYRCASVTLLSTPPSEGDRDA
jgi:iron(III) transport system ATP-binding protein